MKIKHLAIACIFIVLLPALLAACSAPVQPTGEPTQSLPPPPTAGLRTDPPGEKRVYTIDDLHALGFSEDDHFSIYPVGGNMWSEATECPASDLQNFMRIMEALTSGDRAIDMGENTFPRIYRRLAFSGAGLQDWFAGEIDGKAYVLRSSDRGVYDLDYEEYEFMLDFCKVIRPYPEDLDKREFLKLVQDAMENLPIKGHIPGNVNYLSYTLPVETVDDFMIKDSPPYYSSDIDPPEGQYTIIVPRGYFYELQMGLNYEKDSWRITEIKIARSNVGTSICPTNENLRLAVFGPSFTDISGWGMSQLQRVELYDYETGQVWWERDGFCVYGALWSDDGHFVAISHEAGHGSNRGMQVVLLDISGTSITAVNLLPHDGAARSRLQAKEWISDTELRLYYADYSQTIQNSSTEITYDAKAGAFS